MPPKLTVHSGRRRGGTRAPASARIPSSPAFAPRSANVPVPSPTFPTHFPAPSSANSDAVAAGSQKLSEIGLILGIHLQLGRISCVVLGQALEPLHTEYVEFDADCPEYKTNHGVYTSAPTSPNSGASSLTPIDMLVKALDLLLDRLYKAPQVEIKSIRAIGVTAVANMPIFLTAKASAILQSLSPALRLQPQLMFPDFFTVPFVPNCNDASPVEELRHIKADLQHVFTPSSRASSVAGDYDQGFTAQCAYGEENAWEREVMDTFGAMPSLAGYPAQLLKVKTGKSVGFVGEKGSVTNSWDRTEHIVSSGGLICALLAGELVPMEPAEAASTGMFNPTLGQWEPKMLEIVSGGKPAKLESMLGEVASLDSAAAQQIRAGDWLVKRYGFSTDCLIAPSLPSSVAAYLSFLPSPTDGGVGLGGSDELVMPTRSYVPAPAHSMLPNPLAALSKKDADFAKAAKQPSKWLAVVRCQDAGLARSIVRDVYTNSRWSVFRQLANAVSFGGSVGLDNKMFLLYLPQGDYKGIRRYEHGVRVSEFSDLRANSRTCIEGQALHLRAAASTIATLDMEATPAQTLVDGAAEASDEPKRYRGAGGHLAFDPYDLRPLPTRWYVWGKPAGNACIAELLGAILGAPIVIGGEDLDAAAKEDSLNGQEARPPGELGHRITRAAYGAAFVAFTLLAHRKAAAEAREAVPFDALIRDALKLPRAEAGDGSQTSTPRAALRELEPDNAREGIPSVVVADSDSSAAASSAASDCSSSFRGRSPSRPAASSLSASVASRTTSSGGSSTGTSSLHPTSLLRGLSPTTRALQAELDAEAQTWADERSRGLVRLCVKDADLFKVYGALLEEFARLLSLQPRL